MTTFEVLSFTPPQQQPQSSLDRTFRKRGSNWRTNARVRCTINGTQTSYIETFSFRVIDEGDPDPPNLKTTRLALSRLIVRNPTKNVQPHLRHLELSFQSVCTQLGPLYRPHLDPVPFTTAGNSRRVFKSVTRLMQQEGIRVNYSRPFGLGSFGLVHSAQLGQKNILVKHLRSPEKVKSFCFGELVGFFAPESAAPRIYGCIVKAQGHYIFARDYPLIRALRKDHGPAEVRYVLMSNVGHTLHTKRNELFTNEKVYETTSKIFSAIAELHKRKILHGDLKLNNLGVNTRGEIRAFDFGLSYRGNKVCRHITKHHYFQAPECIGDQEHTHQVDIWSTGILLMEGLFHPAITELGGKTTKPHRTFLDSIVYHNATPVGEGDRVGKIEAYLIETGKQIPSLSDSTVKNMAGLISSCLRWNPQERPTAAQALAATFLTTEPESTPETP